MIKSSAAFVTTVKSLGLALLLSSATQAKAELVLEIDPATMTYRWVGSNTDTVDARRTSSYDLGLSPDLSNGDVLWRTNNAGSSLTISADLADIKNYSPTAGNFTIYEYDDVLNLGVYLGNFRGVWENFASVPFSMSITGDGIAYSFNLVDANGDPLSSIAEADFERFILSLDGQQLNIFRTYEGTDEEISGFARIEIIPEPSIALLLLPGLALLGALHARRKSAA